MAKRKGTNRSDNLEGTNTADVFIGLGGSDTMNGRGGGDTFSGGDGSDKIFGGAGNDIIYGHSKADLDPSSGFVRFESIGTISGGGVQTAVAPGDDGFIYALNRTGDISRINTATGNSSVFLNIPEGELGSGGENGTLGMAFHPDYESNGRFFVYMTNASGNIEIREYNRNGGNSPEQVVMTIPHPGTDYHNGGSIAFGPDGYLYLGTGDGQRGGETAQDRDSLLGKILRIDVDGDDFPGDDQKNYAIPDDNPYNGRNGAEEVWALGMRNPWRFSFDSKTGDFYIGDVGESKREEINFIKAGTEGGLNFGWDYREGDIRYENSPGDPPDRLKLTDPVFDYKHDDRGASVTGGVVVQANGQGLNGAYIFSDFVTGDVYSIRVVNGKARDVVDLTDQIRGGSTSMITSFGTDSDGNVLAISISGEIFRLNIGKAAGDGDDQLHGGAGNDKLFGGIGRDKLFGDGGKDKLDGGADNDLLTGGSGADRFIFNTGSGRDRITDFNADGARHDIVDISGWNGIDDFQDLRTNNMEQRGQNVVISQGADEIVLLDVQLSDLSGKHFDL